MRASKELAQIVLGLSIMAVVVLSLIFPWSFRTRVSRQLAHLPLLLFILYPAYELTIPTDTDIRVDLLFMWPAFALVGICYAIKLLILSRSSAQAVKPVIKVSQAAPGSEAHRDGPLPDMDRANKRLAHLLPQPKNEKRA